MKRYSDEWWNKLEYGRVEKASLFGPGALVISQFNARGMVIEAIKEFRRSLKKKDQQ